MNMIQLGTTPIGKGQLITLYVEDSENDRLQQAVILYAMQSFNLSEVMVEYYKQCKNKRTLLKSEIAISSFVDYLIEKGFVNQPKNETVRIGIAGRPPMRLIDEYKYQMNPVSFMQEKLESLINGRCNGVYGYSGNYFNLMKADLCPYTIRCSILIDSAQPIVLEVGVSPSERHVVPNEKDCLKFQTYLQQLFSNEFNDLPIFVEKVFPPTPEEIAVHTTMEKVCKN